MTTTSQCLVKGARHSTETQAAATPLPAYVMEFQSVFAKEDFDILPEHCKWDHAIKLISRAEPKSSKVYPLSPLEQAVRLANSKAGIKPTAPLSAFDKENSMEFSLDFLHYLYNYYMVCALFPHAYHVTHHVTSCDVTL